MVEPGESDRYYLSDNVESARMAVVLNNPVSRGSSILFSCNGQVKVRKTRKPGCSLPISDDSRFLFAVRWMIGQDIYDISSGCAEFRIIFCDFIDNSFALQPIEINMPSVVSVDENIGAIVLPNETI